MSLLPRLNLSRLILSAATATLIGIAGAQLAHADGAVVLDPNARPGSQPTVLMPGVVKRDAPTHLIPGQVLRPSRRPSQADIRKMLERMRRDKAAQKKRRPAPAAPVAPQAPKSKKKGGFTIRVGKHKIRVDGKIRVDVRGRTRRSAPRTGYVPAPRTQHVPLPKKRGTVRHGIVNHGSTSRAKQVTLYSPAKDDLADNGNVSGTDGISWSFHWSAIEGAQAYELVVRAPGSDQDEIQKVTKQPFFKFETQGYVPNTMRTGWTYKVRALVGGVWTTWTLASFDVEEAGK